MNENIINHFFLIYIIVEIKKKYLLLNIISKLKILSSISSTLFINSLKKKKFFLNEFKDCNFFLLILLDTCYSEKK